MESLLGTALRDLYLLGRFKKAATMIFIEIGGTPGYPSKAVVTDTNGNPLGECCLHELEGLLAYGENEKANTGSPNPNLPIVKWALGEMKATDRRVAEPPGKIATVKPANVIRFPTLLRIVENPSVS